MKTYLHRLLLLVLITTVSIGFVGCTTDPAKKKQEHVERGNSFYNAGKYKEASIMYRLAIKIDQRYGEAYYRLGLSELKAGRIMECAGALRRATELMPANVDAHAKLADLYLGAYLTDKNKNKMLMPELRDIATKLLKQDPKSFDGLRINAYLSIADGKIKEAIEGFRAADAVKPLQPELTLALANALALDGQVPEAEKLVNALLAKEKTNSAGYDFLYGAAMRAGKLEQGEAILKNKVANSPTNEQALMQLAAHYFGTQQQPKMKEILNSITANPKDFPFGYRDVGDFYFRIQQMDAAIQAYSEGLKNATKQKSVYQKRMVEVYSAQGKANEALALVDQILKVDEKDSEAIAMRASLWLQAGRKEQLQTAINDLQSVLAKMPDNFVLRFNLGRALVAKGDVEAAKIQFQDSIKIRPDFIPPRLALAQVQLQKGELDTAMQTVTEVLAIQPRNQAAQLLRTTTLLARKDYSVAKGELDALLKANPDSRDARFQLAMVFFSQKDFKKAEEIFKYLMNLTPPDPRGAMGLTETFMASQQYDNAINLIRQLLAKNPDRLDYRVAIGNIQARAGRYDEAMNEFRTVLAKTPNSADLLVKLGEVCKLKRDDNCALDYFKKAAAIDEKDAGPQLRLGLQYDTLGMRTQARPVYETILKSQPDNWVALNNLAYILAEEGKDLDQALTLVQRAKQKQPNEPNIADTMGWIYIKKNLSDPAIQIYKELTVRDSGVSTWHYHLGMALFQRGDKQQAKRALESALSKSPSKDEAAKIKELLAKI